MKAFLPPLLSLLLSPLLMASPASAPARRASCSTVLTGRIRHVRGLPPHRAWQLPGKGWVPLAIDTRFVLMDRQSNVNGREAQPIQMALALIGSHIAQPIPPGAYPHRAILGKWQLEWPWIVGIASSQPMPGPPSWELWAGNVRTGASVILDSAGRGPAPRAGNIEFSLNDGRVAWDVNVIAGSGESRTALYNLKRHTRSFLTPYRRGASDGRITMWGNRVVWEQQTALPHRRRAPYVLMDLMMHSLRTGTTVQLGHSTTHSGSSYMPSLWRNMLLFAHGTALDNGGEVILVNLARHSAGAHRAWWQAYSSRPLGQGAYPSMAGGLANWYQTMLFDVARGTIWSFRSSVKATATMHTVTALGGGYVVVQLMPVRNAGRVTYQVWQIPGTCSGSALT